MIKKLYQLITGASPVRQILIKGNRDQTNRVNVIPSLYYRDDVDPNFDPSIPTNFKNGYDKLSNGKKVLIELYNSEFISTFIQQATDAEGPFIRSEGSP